MCHFSFKQTPSKILRKAPQQGRSILLQTNQHFLRFTKSIVSDCPKPLVIGSRIFTKARAGHICSECHLPVLPSYWEVAWGNRLKLSGPVSHWAANLENLFQPQDSENLFHLLIIKAWCHRTGSGHRLLLFYFLTRQTGTTAVWTWLKIQLPRSCSGLETCVSPYKNKMWGRSVTHSWLKNCIMSGATLQPYNKQKGLRWH